MKTIRIGSGAGYAGDRLEPSLELIEKGNLDYISYECLAERTIAIGQQAKLKDPTKGYNGLLEHRMEKALPLCWKHKVKLITNMGSANPQAAAQKCVEIAKKHGLTGMKIACVTGDDLLPVIDKYMDTEVWETHEPLSKLPGEIVSANAYMGVEGILKALDEGADVVITGRVADPAIFMAPAIHEFGWSLEDWDKLGKGTMMGHLLECGGQVTGGYFAEPGKKDVPGVGHLGFPIVEIAEDGSFFVTKVPEAGGEVTVETCSEQIVYEIHDPENYLTPDVVADFKQVKFTEVAKDKVQVEGATGKPKTDTFKCSIGYKDCFIGDGEISYGGPGCLDRAKLAHTVVGANTKVDNLVQIAHNVKVGQSCIMCSQVGIAGTTTLGNGVVAAGQVGIIGHLHIGNGVQIAAQSGVTCDIPDGVPYFGTPAKPMKEMLRILAVQGKLPEIYKELKLIKKAVEK